MREFHKIWIEQCDAAKGIREDFGLEKAMDYLIREKLLNFIRHSSSYPPFAAELPNFVQGVQEVFAPHEIQSFFENLDQIGVEDQNLPEAYPMDEEEAEWDEPYEGMGEEAVRGAEIVLHMERMKVLLLGETD